MYSFPRTKFVDTFTLSGQLDHISGELLEAVNALNEGESMERVAEELVDAYVSIETALRKIQEQHGINIQQVADYVLSKNELRGYFRG
jgi:NTP pyrophosphatase (non-canonical NTP hydrolase)